MTAPIARLVAGWRLPHGRRKSHPWLVTLTRTMGCLSAAFAQALRTAMKTKKRRMVGRMDVACLVGGGCGGSRCGLPEILFLQHVVALSNAIAGGFHIGALQHERATQALELHHVIL